MNNKSLDTDGRTSFTLVTDFKGYTSRVDQTKLAPGYLVPGSQNVLIDVSGRVKTRLGFTLDGQASTTDSGMMTAYDWEEHKNGTINLRQWVEKVGYTSNIEYRWVDVAGNIIWVAITTGANNVARFTNYWNDTEKENVLLFVDGTKNIFEWNGAFGQVLSSTANTITLVGTSSWADLGFYLVGNKKIMIGGVEYTYTGGETTTTLTGVTPDASGIAPFASVFQKIVTTATSAITNLPTDINIDLISMLDNQVYYASKSSNNVYLSHVNDYKTVAYNAPVRLIGDGAMLTLRGIPTALVPQESSMYISAGKSQWYQTTRQFTADQKGEAITVTPLKTGSGQSAISQEAMTKDKNNVVFVTFEPVLSTLGRVQNQLATPMTQDLSWMIVNDMNKYDFTGAYVKYFKNFIYIALPAEGITLIYNQTDPNNMFWEAPQTLPFSCFSVIDGAIYGHSSLRAETYKMFDGVSDQGHIIRANATFSYMNMGRRDVTKWFNEYYTEGYINPATTLTIGWQYEMDSFATNIKKYLKGDDSQVVGTIVSSASLGKESLGKQPLGGDTELIDNIYPKFRVIETTPRHEFYEFQPYFESEGINQYWEILAFGPLSTVTAIGNFAIKI